MAVRYNPKGYWEDVPAPTAPKFTPPPPAAPQYIPQAVGALNAPQYQPWQIAERITSAQNNVPQTLASQRLENFRATAPSFRPATVPAPVSPFTTPPAQAGMGELRRVEQARTQAANPQRTFDALEAQTAQTTQRQTTTAQNAFPTQYPNAGKLKDAVESDYLGGQVWLGSDAQDVAEFKAWRERTAAHPPTSQELREIQKWEASGWDSKLIPPRMSPYMANFANLTEAERRKHYMTDYPWLRLTADTTAAGTGYGSGYGSGYGYGYGGGGGYSYAKQTPSWFERMLNWRI